MCRLFLTLSAVLALGSGLRAQEPKPELAPMPRTVEAIPKPGVIVYSVPMGPMGPILPGYFLPDPYAQVKWWALDRQGFSKPRVMLYPQPHYLYNGMPYLFFPTNPLTLSNELVPR
ncbi:MAG: hypothetical protein K8T89_26985 [Planctomycetes bacterium]|nr:hypothetical protein [Planctomycetota bacterium]